RARPNTTRRPFREYAGRRVTLLPIDPTPAPRESATYEVGAALPLGPPPGAAAVRAPGEAHPRAVFVTHGMGKQIAFETLDLVAEGLRAEDARKRGVPLGSLPAPRVRSVSFEGERLQRAELSLKRPDGTEREVHVYEGYWAPLTEGQVTLRDVVAFLFRGGWNGIWNAARKKGFRRWLFDQYRLVEIPASTLILLGVAVAVVFGLAALNAAVLIVAVARMPLEHPPRWLSDSLFEDLSTLMNLFLTAALVFGLSLLAARGVRRRPPGSALRLGAGAFSVLAFAAVLGGTALAGVSLPLLFWAHVQCPPAAMSRGVFAHVLGARFVAGFNDAFETGAVACLAAAAGALVLIAAGKLVARAGAEWRAGGRRLLLYALTLFGVLLLAALFAGEVRAAAAFCRTAAGLPVLRRGVSWGLLLALSAWLRSLLVQYPGDLAAYVASHTLDRFHDVRARIKETVWKKARAVYAAASGDGEFAYERCVQVGHSLGSVIAYDILNRLVSEDTAAREAGTKGGLDVAARTPLFLTVGSPLDKTAFVFGVTGKNTTEAREALAATVQPLICDYAVRPARWINVYSLWDIVSGPLELYDLPEAADPRRVQNIRDPAASTLIAAHVEYWRNVLIFEILHAELTS
ncbi:MAG: hypothetical protein ABJC61_10375, partial [Acidobacteriota bacterium]